RERVAEDEAQGAFVAQERPAAPGRRGRRRGRPPRALAALAPDRRDRRSPRARGRPAARPGRAPRLLAGVRGRPVRPLDPGAGGPRVSERMRRVNESLRQVLSESIGDLADPRLGFVTVTGVECTQDLDQATVYVQI